MLHRKPEDCSVCSAEPRSVLVTSGTAAVFGPLETVSETADPRPAVLPPLGLWSMTVLAGSLLSTTRTETVKPAAWSSEVAWSIGSPITDGTEIGCGPFETFTSTTLPTVSFTPGFGACARTSPTGFCDGTFRSL